MLECGSGSGVQIQGPGVPMVADERPRKVKEGSRQDLHKALACRTQREGLGVGSAMLRRSMHGCSLALSPVPAAPPGPPRSCGCLPPSSLSLQPGCPPSPHHPASLSGTSPQDNPPPCIFFAYSFRSWVQFANGDLQCCASWSWADMETTQAPRTLVTLARYACSHPKRIPLASWRRGSLAN